MEDQPKLELEAFELPGGNEPKFNKLTQEQIEKQKRLQVPREWDTVAPADYMLDDYKFDITKKDNGDVFVKMTGVGKDGGKRGIAFEVNGNTPYAITAHHMRACFQALFRHEICKILDKNDEG